MLQYRKSICDGDSSRDGKEIYDKALKEVTELAVDVIEQCVDFAERNDYEKEWVIDRFQEQFLIAKKNFLRN